MTDQCKFCAHRENFELCQQTECFYHDSWYAITLNAKIVEDQAALVKAESDYMDLITSSFCVPDQTLHIEKIHDQINRLLTAAQEYIYTSMTSIDTPEIHNSFHEFKKVVDQIRSD